MKGHYPDGTYTVRAVHYLGDGEILVEVNEGPYGVTLEQHEIDQMDDLGCLDPDWDPSADDPVEDLRRKREHKAKKFVAMAYAYGMGPDGLFSCLEPKTTAIEAAARRAEAYSRVQAMQNMIQSHYAALGYNAIT
jgi:6-phosphogluconolactonase/glucosamine-6-phosphate isomerase/deaminase